MKFRVFLFLVFLFSSNVSFSQDERFQLPLALQKAYFEINVGSIDYNFNKSQFESLDDYTYQSVEVPHTAVRLVLFGYQFNPYFSAQISYMRPVYWVNYKYTNSNYTQKSSVWMNIAGLSVKAQLPVVKNITLFGEFGLGIITRLGGVSYRGAVIVKEANYNSYLLGGGFKYNLNPKIDLLLSSVYSPKKMAVRQPAISFVSAGFSYNLHRLPEEKIKDLKTGAIIHPKHLFQVGYSSLVFGYGINNSFSKIPLFWGGNSEVNHGFSMDYQQNVFRTAKYFSLDWGVGASFLKSNINKESFYTISAYPVFRFDFLHTRPFDAYAYYSIAGPSFISKTIIDDIDCGKKFTFQDNMGFGLLIGDHRNYNLEFKIGHYSNGNLFTQNAGVKIPFSLNVGYAF